MKKILSLLVPILSKKIFLKPKDNVVSSISGGQDSILLFFIILHLKKQWNIKIKLVYFHHFWQQKNFSSMYQVWKLSFLFKTPMYLVFSENFLSNEKIARQWRQTGLNRISTFEGSSKILTGHTASDRLETAFWHLVRGTSPQGLISLKWKTPLLVKIEFFNKPEFNSFFSVTSNYFYDNFIQKLGSDKYFKEKRKFKVNKINAKYVYKKRKNQKKIQNFVYFSCLKSITKFQFTFFSQFFISNTLLIIKQKEVFVLIDDLDFYFFQNIDLHRYLDQGESKLKKKHYKFFKQQDKKIYSFLFFKYIFLKKEILRPLLGFHRHDITFFSKKLLLPIITDLTNKKLYWSRNRIRNQLFPILRFFFNLHTEHVLNNFLEITSEEQRYIKSITDKIFQYLLNTSYQSIFLSENGFFLSIENLSQIKDPKKYYSQFQNQTDLLKSDYLVRIFLARIYFLFQIFPQALQRRLIQKIYQFYKKYQLDLLKIELLRKANKNKI